MIITETFTGNEWLITFETEVTKKTFSASEFPFTGETVTGREADTKTELDAAGNPRVFVWDVGKIIK